MIPEVLEPITTNARGGVIRDSRRTRGFLVLCLQVPQGLQSLRKRRRRFSRKRRVLKCNTGLHWVPWWARPPQECRSGSYAGMCCVCWVCWICAQCSPPVFLAVKLSCALVFYNTSAPCGQMFCVMFCKDSIFRYLNNFP